MIKKKHGGSYLRRLQAKAELAAINRDLKKLKKQIAVLEERKSTLLAETEEGS